MTTDILSTEHAETEALLRSLPNRASISTRGTNFEAFCYEPDDCLRGEMCLGKGPTLAAAISEMCVLVETAKMRGRKLRTAAECKTAVLNLLREHDAAPAAFRDAVDDLDVA